MNMKKSISMAMRKTAIVFLWVAAILLASTKVGMSHEPSKVQKQSPVNGQSAATVTAKKPAGSKAAAPATKERLMFLKKQAAAKGQSTKELDKKIIELNQNIAK